MKDMQRCAAWGEEEYEAEGAERPCNINMAKRMQGEKGQNF